VTATVTPHTEPIQFSSIKQERTNATSKEEIQIENNSSEMQAKGLQKRKRKLIKEKLKVGLKERQSKNKRDIETESNSISYRPVQTKRNNST